MTATASPVDPRRRRRQLAASVPVLVVVGLTARFGLAGAAGDAAGGVLYAALAYVLIACARPALPPWIVGCAALAFSVAVELLQLSSAPATLADWFPPIRLLLGTSFAAADFPPYVAGALIAAAIDGAARRRAC